MIKNKQLTKSYKIHKKRPNIWTASWLVYVMTDRVNNTRHLSWRQWFRTDLDLKHQNLQLLKREAEIRQAELCGKYNYIEWVVFVTKSFVFEAVRETRYPVIIVFWINIYRDRQIPKTDIYIDLYYIWSYIYSSLHYIIADIFVHKINVKPLSIS